MSHKINFENANMVEELISLDQCKGLTFPEILDMINEPKEPSDKPLGS